MSKSLAGVRVLIIDDNEDIIIATKILLKQNGAEVHSLDSPIGVIDSLSSQSIDVVLLDMNFNRDARSGDEGLEALQLIREHNKDVAVVAMTAYGSLDLGISVMKSNADDFIVKPWHNERLLKTIANCVKARQQSKKIERLESTQKELLSNGSQGLSSIIGSSKAITDVKESIDRVGRTDATVLLLGESGSGKEVAARAIHEISSRRDEPFVSIDMGAIPEDLFESELFGHKKGSFTGAQSDRLGRFLAAGKGTLFLDEIGNLPLVAQAKLLRALESKEITPVGSRESFPLEARIVAATNDNLALKVAQGQFRQDLLYRVNTVEVDLPPLRARPVDVIELAEHFLAVYSVKYQRMNLTFMKEALDALKEWNWPGNVRELQHTIERAVIMSSGEVIKANDLFATPKSAENRVFDHDFKTLNLKELEKGAIKEALRINEGNVTKAANDLGLNRTSLYRRLEKHGLH